MEKKVKIGIGHPIVSPAVPLQFYVSMMMMEKPEYTFILPQFPSGEFLRDIAISRNNIVRQAREEECTHFIMLDTDQIYPTDAITKLLSHDKDVVGVHVHRSWKPYDPILLRGEKGKYHHVSDEECFSGDLVPVDATGAGGICFNMEVFDAIPEPWFELVDAETGKDIGEDILFAHKIRKAGFEIFVDTSIRCGHISSVVIAEDYYRTFKACHKFGWTTPKEKQ